ncbi:alpha/beta hydrolase [Gloeocapsa sp. BRSZ]
MSIVPDVLWINTSPSLQCFHRPLLCYLSHHLTVAQWEYCQTQDEPCSLDVALELLHDYLQSCDRPVHLIGHSTSGLLGLLYARRYPDKVKSLTLLAVGADPALDWQAHYYNHRKIMSCQRVLTSMAYNLFGSQDKCTINSLIKRLQKDLYCSLSPHSFLQRVSLPASGVPVPLMVCGGTDDIIIESADLQGWKDYLKAGDRLWLCPQGKHFFHYFQHQLVGEQITNFWQFTHQSALLHASLLL